MIKYSTSGLVQFWNQTHNLFNILYSTAFIAWSSAFYICSLVNPASLHNEMEQGEVTEKRRTTKIAVATVFFTAFLSMFLNVRYQNKKKPTRFRIQYNVLTFDQSFYSYVLYFVVEWALLLLNLRPKFIGVFLFICKLIFFHCIVPLFILLNLKNSMPFLFSENNRKKELNSFYMTKLYAIPRRDKFLPFKKFDSNARWGSEKKFQNLNQNLFDSHSEKKNPNVLTPVDV